MGTHHGDYFRESRAISGANAGESVMDHKTMVVDMGGEMARLPHAKGCECRSCASGDVIPGDLYVVCEGAGGASAGSGGGNGYYRPGDNQKLYGRHSEREILESIRAHKAAGVRLSTRVREDVMMALLGKGFPMRQVITWALEAVKIAEAYPEEHRGSFMAALRASFQDPRTCCDQSIQDAKEATDFIISGQSSSR